jgi:hypothetical protein
LFGVVAGRVIGSFVFGAAGSFARAVFLVADDVKGATSTESEQARDDEAVRKKSMGHVNLRVGCVVARR